MGGRIPQSFIDELLHRVDIVDVVNMRVPLKKAGRDFTACCPFHSEKTPSFTVSPRKQFYHCFGCGSHGNVIGFLMEHDRLEFPEAVEELAGSLGLQVPREGGTANRATVSTGALEILDGADQFFRKQLHAHPQSAHARQYLEDRGVSEALIEECGIGFAPDSWNALAAHMTGRGTGEEALLAAGLLIRNEQGRVYDRFRGRIMFPIRNRRGRTIAFGGRNLGVGTPKYLNSPETDVFHKGRELYGLWEARNRYRKLERLLVVEGYMDVLALAQFGIGYAVATLGTSTTREHLDMIYRNVPRVVFCFDGDRAGRDAAWRALENALPMMRDGREAHFLFLPDGEDPDSLVRVEGAQAFESRLDRAKPLSEFLIEQLSRGIDMGTPDGRATLIERTRPHLSRVPGGAFWELMVAYLAELTRLSLERVLSLLTRGEEPVDSTKAQKLATRTPVRHAIALVLYDPGLARNLPEPACLPGNNLPGMALLRELIEFARTGPHVSTGSILERYRGGAHEKALHRLAAWEPELPDEALQSELWDTLKRLGGRHDPQHELLDKVARGQALTEEERGRLRSSQGTQLAGPED